MTFLTTDGVIIAVSVVCLSIGVLLIIGFSGFLVKIVLSPLVNHPGKSSFLTHLKKMYLMYGYALFYWKSVSKQASTGSLARHYSLLKPCITVTDFVAALKHDGQYS